MKRLPFVGSVLAVMAAAVVGVGAEEKAAKAAAKLEDFKIGEIVNWVPFKPEDLNGKVVAIEFWGVNCPPCVASLPDMQKLASRYDSKGFVMVGVHSQNATDEQINKVLKKARVEYPVARNGSSPIDFSGIPRIFLFDRSGAMVFQGNPHDDEFMKALRKTMSAKAG